ncbi:hypothetical protein [Sphingobium sp. HDIP04]|nr:hypothetical protein [Sphingobium sp. HDIP04]EQB07161.1 hypothetical protein L286_04395 [Sphingobium sp. HDIP04]
MPLMFTVLVPPVATVCCVLVLLLMTEPVPAASRESVTTETF